MLVVVIMLELEDTIGREVVLLSGELVGRVDVVDEVLDSLIGGGVTMLVVELKTDVTVEEEMPEEVDEVLAMILEADCDVLLLYAVEELAEIIDSTYPVSKTVHTVEPLRFIPAANNWTG